MGNLVGGRCPSSGPRPLSGRCVLGEADQPDPLRPLAQSAARPVPLPEAFSAQLCHTPAPAAPRALVGVEPLRRTPASASAACAEWQAKALSALRAGSGQAGL